VPITASLAVWFDRCPVRPTVIRAETRNSYRLPRRRLADFIDCRWHGHTARKARIVNGEVLQETGSRQQLIAPQPAARSTRQWHYQQSAKR